jgi:predicted O-methyltransferase YrrM
MEKLKTLIWFASRPSFYAHMLALIGRKLRGATRHESHYAASHAWAARLAVARDDALRAAGLEDVLQAGVPRDLLEVAAGRVRDSGVAMGGAGDLDLLYRAILASRSRRVIETGVAYGWSSLAALAALRETDGRLVSVDMPYPKAATEAFVGVAVPDGLRERWTLIREPDRNGLRKAIRTFEGRIDLCHYDSDKSYPGRMFAYPLLWDALRPGGLFISDDIQDNFAFRDFFEQRGISFGVTESDGKFVGIARKPG